MKYFEFLNDVKIINGEHSIKKVPEELKRRGALRPMLITGPTLTKIGVVDAFRQVFDGSEVQIKGFFNQVPNDSSLEVVNEIAKLYLENNCDSIIALGGGSNIDTAKGVKLILAHNDTDIEKYMGLERTPYGKNIPFCVIPTTSGTGSEATKVAVISDLKKHVKLEFITSEIIPDFCILDPHMVASLPKRATFTTGLDTLTHAIEGYTGTQSQPLTDMFAYKAIKLFAENIVDVVEDGKNLKAREGMLMSSLFAGIAFSNSMVGIVHAIGHALGGVAKIAHDLAMTMLIVPCMKYNKTHLDEKYKNLDPILNNIKMLDADGKEVKFADNCIDSLDILIKEMGKKIGLKLTLKENGVTKDMFDDIVETALKDGAKIANRKYFGKEEVINILEEIY